MIIKMIRKGLIFILTNDIEKVYNYIISNIQNDKITQNKRMFKYELLINDYKITIINDINNISRGHKPEISYIIGNIEVHKFGDIDFLKYISNISTRKEPVRKIDSVERLDIKEFLDDNYAEENYCAKHRVKYYTTLHTTDFSKEVAEFEKEYPRL
jgi:hypothetical protein